MKNYDLALEKANTDYEQSILKFWMTDIYQQKAGICTDKNEKTEYRLSAIKYTELQTSTLIKMQCATSFDNYNNAIINQRKKLGDFYQPIGKYLRRDSRNQVKYYFDDAGRSQSLAINKAINGYENTTHGDRDDIISDLETERTEVENLYFM